MFWKNTVKFHSALKLGRECTDRLNEKPNMVRFNVTINKTTDVYVYILSSIGDLLNKAKEKVMLDGYQYVKGKSRSKSASETESEGPSKKRAKTNSEERSREINLLEENLKTSTNRLSFKERQLDKERTMQNYKQCDAISGEMMKIRNERAEVERQLSAIKKKEAKSTWYKKKAKKEKIVNESTARDSQRKIPSLLKKSLSASSSTDESHDTLILSDCSHDTLIVSDDGRDSLTSGDEIPSSQRMQNFP